MSEEKKTRERGTGCLYLRGDIWHAKWYADGKAYTQSTKQTDEQRAEKFLRKQLAKVETGTFAGTRVERIRVSELADDFLRDYKINGRKSLDDTEARYKLHLKPAFGHLRASRVSTSLINEYVDDRQEAGASNATINRELAALKRMFTIGSHATPPKVNRIPHFNMLKESNVRSGFVNDEQYGVLAGASNEVGAWLRALLEVAYTYGWRVSELLTLQVRQVDLSAGTIRLDAGTTKNDDGRVVKMTATVKALISTLLSGKKSEERVFTRDGTPIADFRGAWERSAAKLGPAK
jgi:integrase